jgi:hypothetical protein
MIKSLRLELSFTNEPNLQADNNCIKEQDNKESIKE